MTIADTIFAAQGRSHALLLTTFASVGLIVGAILAERAGSDLRRPGLLLSGASGVLFSLVAMVFTPFVQSTVERWLVPLLFMAGGATYILLCRIAETFGRRAGERRKRLHERGDDPSPDATVSAVAIIDLIGSGIAMGLAAAASVTLAILVAIGLAAVNISTSRRLGAGLMSLELRRMDRIAAIVMYALVFNAAALLAFWAIHSVDNYGLPWLLAFFGGLLLVAAARTLIADPQEFGAAQQRSLIAFVGGFAIYVLATAGAGEVFDALDISKSGLEHPAERSLAASNDPQPGTGDQ